MNWLTQLFARRRHYDELSESIREHLDEKIADLIDSGMTSEEAGRAARRDFGNITRIEERSREVWQWPTLESLCHRVIGPQPIRTTTSMPTPLHSKQPIPSAT